MIKFKKIALVTMMGTLMLSGGFIGCTKKPNTEELGKLEEAKAAAESAERKLSELRVERMKLEKELNESQGEVQNQQQELNEVK